MNSLDRLLELVRRTQLPTIIRSTEGDEACVVLPLTLYERLSGGIASEVSQKGAAPEVGRLSAEPQSETDPFLETLFGSIPSKRAGTALEEGESSVRLQDLLGQSKQIEGYSAVSAAFPQKGGLEDRFAFDGLDIRILPHSRQKMSLEQDSLDES